MAVGRTKILHIIIAHSSNAREEGPRLDKASWRKGPLLKTHGDRLGLVRPRAEERAAGKGLHVG